VNLSKLARALTRAAVITRDVNAVRRGRIGQRLDTRMVGRQVGRLTRGLGR
jgi:hypothetical protein